MISLTQTRAINHRSFETTYKEGQAITYYTIQRIVDGTSLYMYVRRWDLLSLDPQFGDAKFNIGPDELLLLRTYIPSASKAQPET
jgi:hypothetical protein